MCLRGVYRQARFWFAADRLSSTKFKYSHDRERFFFGTIKPRAVLSAIVISFVNILHK